MNYTGKIVEFQNLPVYDAPFKRVELSPWLTVQNVQLATE
jgi:hypothetical protein